MLLLLLLLLLHTFSLPSVTCDINSGQRSRSPSLMLWSWSRWYVIADARMVRSFFDEICRCRCV